ncbi:MAG: leucine-rich repeat protein [Clostridia bacterium]|nr:leucine-rich repeat protein [Clostridia bacterium]
MKNRVDFSAARRLLLLALAAAVALLPIRMRTAGAEAPSGFEYLEVDGKAVITGYSGEAADLTIPETLDGLPVAAVRDLGIQSDVGTITIPDSVALEDGAISFCSALREIRVSENHPSLRLIDGVLFSKDAKTLLCYPSEFPGEIYTVPEGTEAIGAGAFWDCPFLREVVLPEGLKVIGTDAFGLCIKLTAMEIPVSVEVIGEMAFANAAFESLDLSGNIQLKEVSARLASGCWQLSAVSLPDSITRIGDEAFAFTALASFELPASVEIIGINPFRGCADLQVITLTGAEDRFTFVSPFLIDIQADTAICCVPTVSGDISLPEVSRIGDFCCFCCDGIIGIEIPHPLRQIGQYAFASSYALETVTIRQADSLVIGDGVFEDCPGLSALTILGSVAAIGTDAFSGNDLLTRVITDSDTVRAYFSGTDIQVAVSPEGIPE